MSTIKKLPRPKWRAALHDGRLRGVSSAESWQRERDLQRLIGTRHGLETCRPEPSAFVGAAVLVTTAGIDAILWRQGPVVSLQRPPDGTHSHRACKGGKRRHSGACAIPALTCMMAEPKPSKRQSLTMAARRPIRSTDTGAADRLQARLLAFLATLAAPDPSRLPKLNATKDQPAAPVIRRKPQLAAGFAAASLVARRGTLAADGR